MTVNLISISPIIPHLMEPINPILNATTSSVAEATRLDDPTTKIIPGTPINPPTAIVAASIPVKNPIGTINHTEILLSAIES